MSGIPRPRGLRGRLVLAFGVGALIVSATFAASTYALAHSYLMSQRERSVTRQVYAHANFARDRLETAGTPMSAVLTAIDPPADWTVIIRRGSRWFSSSLDLGRESMPDALRAEVEAGNPASMRIRIDGRPWLAVGIPVPAVDGSFYEIAPLEELEGTLRILSGVLAGGALLAAGAGAGLGLWASRSVLRPLGAVGSTAARIAGGQLETRLPATRDPDLAAIVGSFNSMVDTLQQRIERDARLAADVSHELRSPLTTLVASVDILNRRRAELPPRSQQALDLITAELERFRHLLDNLLELARADAGLDPQRMEPVPLVELLSHTLARHDLPEELLDGPPDLAVLGDKLRLERAFANLLDNATRHGGGVAAVSVLTEHERVLILVDDKGPGVPQAERERVFDRFATGRSSRGSSSGTGLGLAIVAESIRAHGGAVWCTDRPEQGARFITSLPRMTDESSNDG